MTKITKKNNYYYLQKSFRENGKVITKEKYLGLTIPKNIDILKEDFDTYVRYNRFEKDILKIKENYNKEYSKLPKLAKQKFLENFAIKFTYNSEAIEGSTLTLKDTKLLIEDGIAPPKLIKEIEQTREHHKLFFEMLKYKDDISLQTVLYWHKKLFERTYPNIAGVIRKHNVAVSGSKTVFPDHIETPYLLEEFFNWYKNNKNKFNPVELAALVHIKFVSIHPFTDGNGRMSRLLMNFILYKNNYPLLDIQYKDRRSYYNALEKSNTNKDDNHFAEFIIKKFLKEYKDLLEDATKLSEQTKRNIKQSQKDFTKGKTHTLEEVKKKLDI